MAEALRNLGVTHAFGIIGKSICPIALKLVDYGIEFIPGRHESSSGFAAGGYALQTGKLGIAFGTSGPGGTNLLTAAAHAKANNLPVLFITGHQSIKELGIPQCQDSTSYLADLAEMFRPATLYSKLVERGDHFSTILNHALSIALGDKKARSISAFRSMFRQSAWRSAGLFCPSGSGSSATITMNGFCPPFRLPPVR